MTPEGGDGDSTDREAGGGSRAAPDSEPTPPETAPQYVVDGLERQDVDTLRALATYADRLAAWRSRERGGVGGPEDRAAASGAASDAGAAGDDVDDSDDGAADAAAATDESGDRPADVPSKATVVVKEINDNRYYYWQWREGDTVTSKYKGPVDSSD